MTERVDNKHYQLIVQFVILTSDTRMTEVNRQHEVYAMHVSKVGNTDSQSAHAVKHDSESQQFSHGCANVY